MTGAAFSIRRAVADDAEALLALRGLLGAETPSMLLEPSELQVDVARERTRIEWLNSRPNASLFLAEEDHSLVGMLSASGGDARRQRHTTSLALGVLRSHWGKGIATAMVQHALEWSRTSGLRRVELSVHTTNLRAIEVYLRCGFRLEGTRRCSLIIDGKYVDEYMMSVIHDRE